MAHESSRHRWRMSLQKRSKFDSGERKARLHDLPSLMTIVKGWRPFIIGADGGEVGCEGLLTAGSRVGSMTGNLSLTGMYSIEVRIW